MVPVSPSVRVSVGWLTVTPVTAISVSPCLHDDNVNTPSASTVRTVSTPVTMRFWFISYKFS